MKEDDVALWLESIAEDEPLPPQPGRKAIRTWLERRAKEQILAAASMAGWYCLAADDDLTCRCGEEPYTDGEPCPACWALEMFEMHCDVLKPSMKGKLPCRKSDTKNKAAD